MSSCADERFTCWQRSSEFSAYVPQVSLPVTLFPLGGWVQAKHDTDTRHTHTELRPRETSVFPGIQAHMVNMSIPTSLALRLDKCTPGT